jgi:hypothetical protein
MEQFYVKQSIRNRSFDRKKFLELGSMRNKIKLRNIIHHLEKFHYHKNTDEIEETILFDPVTYIADSVY